MRKLAKSKKGWYNWFVLIIALILLVTAFITLVMSKESMFYNTLGLRSQYLLGQTVNQDLLQLRTEECANRAANRAVQMMITDEVPDKYIYYQYNEKANEKIFLDYFYIEFQKELKEQKIPYKFDKKTINIKNGNKIYGFADREVIKDKIEYYSEGEKREFAEYNMSYIPKFSYEFPNYNLEDIKLIYSMMNDFVIEQMKECKKNNQNIDDNEMSLCILKEYDKLGVVDLRKQLKISYGNDCLTQFDNKYFSYYTPLNTKYSVFTHTLDYYTVCLEDTRSLLSGVSKKGDFLINNPQYIFFVSRKNLDDNVIVSQFQLTQSGTSTITPNVGVRTK